MIIRFVVKISLLTLLLACAAVSAQAAQLWPLKTGAWMEMDKHDSQDNSWTVRIMVFEEKTLDNKQYFRVQELYYDPYGGDTFSEFSVRSTETEVYFYNGAGQGETLIFKTGQVGDSWEYIDEGSTIRKEILSTHDPVTIQGVNYTAYKYKHYNKYDPNPENYDLEWVVPGLGLVKEEDHWLDSSQANRIPLKSTLARVGSNSLFIPLKSGMRLSYDASDQQSHTWKMTLQVLEQVTLNDGLRYFHMRQLNYDPIGGRVNDEFYVRSTVSQLFARQLDENPAHLEFQAAGPGTAWDYPRDPGTIYKRISSIQSVNVLGGSYLAYVTDQSPDSGFPIDSLLSQLIVPGLGPVEMLDWWIADGNRTPLQYLLTGITQGGAGPAVDLLLLN